MDRQLVAELSLVSVQMLLRSKADQRVSYQYVCQFINFCLHLRFLLVSHKINIYIFYLVWNGPIRVWKLVFIIEVPPLKNHWQFNNNSKSKILLTNHFCDSAASRLDWASAFVVPYSVIKIGRHLFMACWACCRRSLNI